jgi:hypothetical protein
MPTPHARTFQVHGIFGHRSRYRISGFFAASFAETFPDAVFSLPVSCVPMLATTRGRCLKLTPEHTAALGQSRRFEHATSTSASPSIPDIFRRRSERSKRATSGHTSQLPQIVAERTRRIGRELFFEHVRKAHGFVEPSCPLVWLVGNCGM